MQKIRVTACESYFDRSKRQEVYIDWSEGLSILQLKKVLFPEGLEMLASVNGKKIISDDGLLKPGDHVVFIPVPLGGNDIIDRLVNPFSSGHDPWEAIKDTFSFANNGGSVWDQALDAARRNIQALPGVGGLANWTETLAKNNPWIVQIASLGAGLWTYGVGSWAVNYIAQRYGIIPNGQAPSVPGIPNVPSVGVSGGGGGGGMGGGGGGGAYDASNSYAWNPQTLQQMGAIVPRIYGWFPSHGNIISASIDTVVAGSHVGDQVVSSLFLICQGPIVNIFDLKINRRPIEQYPEVQYDWRPGYMNQSAMPDFNDTFTPFTVSRKLVYATAIDYTTEGDYFDGLKFTFNFPGGLYQIESTRTELHYEPIYLDWQDAKGVWHHDLIGQKYIGSSTYGGGNASNTVRFSIYYRKTGSGALHTLWQTITITDTKTSSFSKTYRLDGLEHSQYDIRVVLETEDSSVPGVFDDVYLTTVTEIIKDDFAYPRMALIGIKALATSQLSGSMDFSCLVQGAIVQVWNGSAWVYQWSDNPAWVAYDILTMPTFNSDLTAVNRYDGVDPSQVDTASFYAWAQFCDELVTDGKSASEKRFVFNGVFDYATSQWDALLEVCRMSRAMVIPVGFKYYAIFDNVGTPTQMFTSGNIIQGSLKETFLSTRNRASEIEVDYCNEENDYQRETVTIMDPNASVAKQLMTVQYIGCTKVTQAWRTARYTLYNNQYVVRTIEFMADIDAIACRVGDLIYFAHELPQWGYSGRVEAATTTQVTFDRTVPFENGITYRLRMRKNNDELIYRDSVGTGGTTNSFVCSPALGSSEIIQYDLYTYGEVNMEAKPFRIENIQPNPDLTFTITAVEYNETIYNCDIDEPAYPTPNYSSLDAIPSVSNIYLDEIVTKSKQGDITNNIDVYFTRPDNFSYSYAEIYIRTTTTYPVNWDYKGRCYTDHYRIENIPLTSGETQYEVMVVTITTVGLRQPFDDAPKSTITAVGYADPPSNVTVFGGSQIDNQIRLDWTHIEDADLWGYELRMGVNWDTGLVLGSKITDDYFYYTPEITGTYQFFICAIDTSNHYSTSPKSCVVNAVNITPALNIIYNWNYVNTPASGTMQHFTHAGPPGVFDGNCEAKTPSMGGSVGDYNCNSALSSTQAYEGGKSLALRPSGITSLYYYYMNGPNWVLPNDFAMMPGRKYQISCYYYLPNYGTGANRIKAIQIGFHDRFTAGSDYNYTSASGTVKDAWTYISHSHTARVAASGDMGVEIRLPGIIGTPTGTDYSYFDNIQCREITGDALPCEFSSSLGTGGTGKGFQYHTGVGSGYFQTSTIDLYKDGAKTIRLVDEVHATEDAHDLTFPDRTDLTYPDDNDLHVTTDYYKYPSYLASTGSGFDDGCIATPYFGPTGLSGRFFKVREDFRIPSTTASLVLKTFRTIIDVPEQMYKLTNVSVASGGTSITFSTYGLTFYATPVIGATIINSSVSLVPYIYNKSATGFTVKLIDIVGAGVAGTADINIYGY